MKVYFSVIGIGLGHITRCLSIARQLSQEGIECVFSSYGKAAKLAKEAGYTTYTLKDLMWYEDEKGHVDFERTLLHGPLLFKCIAGHFVEEDTYLKKEKPDLVVIDSRYSTIPASKNLYVPRVYITNQPRFYMPKSNNGHEMTPLEYIGNKFNYRLLSGQDRILIPDFPLPHSISQRHMKFRENAPDSFIKKTEFVGPISYDRPGNRTDGEVEEICKGYGLEPGNFIYIAFSGPGELRENIRDGISQFFPRYKTPSIMGTGDTGETRSHRRGNMILVDGWIKDRDALIQGASLVVCRAGLSTLSELLAYGKKAVVIPQANQPEQESNSQGIENLGSAKTISPLDVDTISLKKTIEYVESSIEMKKSAEKAKVLAARWKGEVNSARVIKELLKAHQTTASGT